MFPYSNKTLYNLLETAPETWDGGNYDEKADVFSFSIILWRLFGSSSQYCASHEDLDREFWYLQKNGKFIPPPKQREVIRKVK